MPASTAKDRDRSVSGWKAVAVLSAADRKLGADDKTVLPADTKGQK